VTDPQHSEYNTGTPHECNNVQCHWGELPMTSEEQSNIDGIVEHGDYANGEPAANGNLDQPYYGIIVTHNKDEGGDWADPDMKHHCAYSKESSQCFCYCHRAAQSEV
jgi:hypothetical protein